MPGQIARSFWKPWINPPVGDDPIFSGMAQPPVVVPSSNAASFSHILLVFYHPHYIACYLCHVFAAQYLPMCIYLDGLGNESLGPNQYVLYIYIIIYI